MSISDPKEKLSTLTKRQIEVLKGVCNRLPYKAIAEELVVTEAAIKSHMANIYVKLGLEFLDRTERVVELINVYCPLLEKLNIEPEPEISTDKFIEPVPSPKVEKMVEEDEKALMIWNPGEIIDAEVREIPPRRRLGCIQQLIWIIIGGVLFAALFFIFGGGIPGIGDTNSPAPQDEVADAPMGISDTPQVVLPSDTPVVIVVSATSLPASATPQFTNTPPPTATTIPSPTPEPNTPLGSILEVGEWWKQDGVWLRLASYEFGDTFPSVRIILEFWNKTNGTLLFSWNTSGSLSLQDNNGFNYPLTSQFNNQSDNENVDAGELIEVRLGQYGYTAVYQDDALYGSGVTELILTVYDFSRIPQAQFRIPIN